MSTETIAPSRYEILAQDGDGPLTVRYVAGTLHTALQAILGLLRGGAAYACQRDTMPHLDAPRMTTAEEREAMRALIPRTVG